MLPLGKTDGLESVAIATRRFILDEVSKHLSLRLAEGLARRLEALCIFNGHGEGRLHAGRRCLPVLDSCNWSTGGLVLIRTVACFMPGLAASVTQSLVPFLLGLPAILREMAVPAAVGAFDITSVTRRHVARRLPRPIGCTPTSGTALTPPSGFADKPAASAAPPAGTPSLA